MKNWKKILKWFIIGLFCIFTGLACYSWGLFDLLGGACVFDKSAFDSACMLE
ncbi:MAG: hypothetical protein OEV66_09005 [Spirochaetia bacterium]|nr:hypothetical protein [Spirochaetia bacterium]